MREACVYVGEGGRRVLGFLEGSWWADTPSSGIHAFWIRELFYLGLIREEGTVGRHSGDVGVFCLTCLLI